MMKILCTFSALVIVLTIIGCDVQPVPRQPSESQPGVVQEPIALPQDAPQVQDYYPQQGNVYPQQQGMVYPQQQGMVYPQQQGMYPQQQGMVYPQQQGTAYQQQLPVSQEPIELPLGVEPRPGMEIIQEPGQQPRLVYPDGSPVQGGPQPQAGYNAPVTSGPPAAYQQNVQDNSGLQGLETGVIYQQGPNGQLVPVPQNGDPNGAYQQYPQQGYPQQGYPQQGYPQQGQSVVYPPGYAPQQYPQQQVYYPPQQQGATMQKRDPSGQMVEQPGNSQNMGYFSKPYGAPQGMYGQQPYYPPATQGNTGVSYPPVNNQPAGTN